MEIKKIIVLFFLLGICVACSNDDSDDDYYQSYLNGTYQNYSSSENKNVLILMYNNKELINKEVSFQTSDHKVAKITFANIIENESETVITDIQLKTNEEDGGFDFSGTYTSKSSAKYRYSGNIVMYQLTFSIEKQ